MIDPKIVQAGIYEALERLGIQGQINFSMGRVVSTQWIGKPGPDDQLITVAIRPTPEIEMEIAAANGMGDWPK